MSKIYTKGVWVDEVLVGDPRYNIKEDDGTAISSTVQIELSNGVVQAGSSADAAKMNNIEEGIDALDTLLTKTLIYSANANVESLSAGKTLTDASAAVQYLAPNGANRDVTLPALGSGNHVFVIANTASVTYTLTVKTAAGVTVTTIQPGSSAILISGGSSGDWKAFAMDHGALSGLGDDDHAQYLLATGLREWSEEAGDPATPGANKWKLYFKAGGLYLEDDGGAVIGPLGTTYLPFVVYGGLPNALAATTLVYTAGIPVALIPKVWSQAAFVASNNDNSNYWTINLINPSASVTYASFDTKADGNATWTVHRLTSFSPTTIPTSDIAVYIYAVKTGSPGALSLGGPALAL